MKLTFEVAVCLGRCDGGTVFVSVEVTDKEFERLKKCYANNANFEDYPGLKRLYKRICRDAIEESISYDLGGEADHTDANCIVYMPDEMK